LNTFVYKDSLLKDTHFIQNFFLQKQNDIHSFK